MSQDKKKGYPKIAPTNWFGLRNKLKQRVPAKLSVSYVASVLSMSETSARANVITPLKALGIIAEDGKPTDLAYDWRDDSKYAEVCEKIIKDIYPQELRDLYHDDSATSAELTSWFMRSGKVGEPAARMHGVTYAMLLKKDPTTKESKKSSSPKPKKEKSVKQKIVHPKKKEKSIPDAPKETNLSESQNNTPSLHIDVQVHISPESSPEQIDKIFESMSKHLKGFKS